MNSLLSKVIKFTLFPTILFLLSACSVNPYKDFLNNFVEDNRRSDGSFESRVVCMAYGDKGKYMIVGHESGKIDIWDMKKTQSKRVINAHEMRADRIAFTSDGEHFFSSSSTWESTKLWNASTGELVHLLPNTIGPVCATPDENIYLIANTTEMSLFDYRQKSLLSEKYVTSGVVTVMAVDPASANIAVGTASGSIELWKFAATGQGPSITKVQTIKPYDTRNWVVGLQFSIDGKSLFSIARFGSIDEWAVDSMEKRRSYSTSLKYIYSTAFNRVKGLIALGGTIKEGGKGPGAVELVSLASGISKMCRVKTNLPNVEFLPPVDTLIATHGKLVGIYEVNDEHPCEEKNAIEKLYNYLFSSKN